MTGNLRPLLRVRAFQALEVTIDDQPVTKFEADTARALFAYLAMHPGTAIKRETLAALFWDATDNSAALTNLRSALRRIRTALDAAASDAHVPGPDIILADRTTMTFVADDSVWVDALDFDRLLADVRRHAHAGIEECPECVARLQAASALYRGAFLADVRVDSPGFEEWRRIEDERFRRMAMFTLYTLGEHAFRNGAFPEAEHLARRQLAIENWNEEAHRQLMRVLFASGRRTAALAQYETCRNILAEELGVDPDDETQSLYLRLLAGESPTPRQIGQSPYKGLSAFGQGDAEVFFCREAVTRKLEKAIAEQGVVALIGASGSGKSSVINAGLVPVLLGTRRDGPPELADPAHHRAVWKIGATRPGDDPIAKLDAALAQLQTEADGSNLLLAIDQFEELFTGCEDEALRSTYLGRLLDATGSNGAQAPRLLLAMRADFLGEALRYANLADLLQNHTILLGPLGRGELQRIIEEPARLRGVAFEPGLVDRLLTEVGDGPGNLPLLQFALTQLWDRQSDGWITHAAFDEIGGVRGALARYAEQVFAELSPEQQDAASHVFLTLVQPSSDAQDVRRLATRAEIGEQRWPLVQHLAGARLLVTNHDARSGETVELVHEALIREWERLQGWLEEDREFQTWRQRTRAAQATWAENPADENTLLRGIRLLEAERWLGDRNDDIDDQLRAFVSASVAAHMQRATEKEAARQRELENAQALARAERKRADAEAQRRRQITWMIAVLLAFALLACAIAIMAFLLRQEADSQRARAEQNARIALARQLAAQSINMRESQVDLAMLLNLVSLQLDTDPDDTAELMLKTDIDPRLRKILHGGGGAIYGLKLQDDGQSVLAHNEYGSLFRWDGPSGKPEMLLPSTAEDRHGVVFSHYGDKIITWQLGVMTVRDAESNVPVFEIAAPDVEHLYSLAFSPDNSHIVSYWADGVFRIWDATTGALVEEHAVDLGERDLLTVVSNDGKIVLLKEEQDNKPLLQFWNVATDSAVAILPQLITGEVQQAVVSPDGSTLATASDDGNVRLWDAKTGEQKLEPLHGHDARVLFAAFSPDGKTLASGGTDNTVILWDAESGTQIGAALSGHGGAVRTAAFSQDGSLLVTGDSDGKAFVWDLDMIHPLAGHDDRVRAVALSPDEKTLVSAGFDKQLIVRDADTLRIEQQIPTEHKNAILNATFSPDGKTFATVDAGGLLILWGTATWAPLHTLRSEDQSELVGLAFSPDNRLVATGSFNGIIEIHDVQTGEPVVAPFNATNYGWALSLLFSPDGKRLYSGSTDQTIRMWDTSDYSQIGEPLTGHTGWVTDLALSPDGSTLVSSSADKTIRIWDAETGAPIAAPLQGHEQEVWNVVFRTIADRVALVSLGGDGTIIRWDWETRTPQFPPVRTYRETDFMRMSADGQRIYLGSIDAVASVVDVANSSWSQYACAIANRNFTETEWQYYLPELPQQTICPETPGAAN